MRSLQQLVGAAWLAVLLFFSTQAAVATPVCPPPLKIDSAIIQDVLKIPQPDRGFLWEVTQGGFSGFLYGTLHVAQLPWAFPGPKVSEALKRSERLAVELDVTDPKVVSRIQGNAAPEPVNAAIQARLDRQFEVACLKEQAFGQADLSMKIMYLGILSARDHGLYPELAIDSVLIGYMRSLGKPIIELESAEEQRAALQRSPEHADEDLTSLENGDTRKQVIELATAWSNSDDRAMESFVAAIPDELRGQLLDQRNETLAQRIDRIYTTQGQAFVAVGALHMFGPGNVIQRLRALDYTIRQIVPVQAR